MACSTRRLLLICCALGWASSALAAEPPVFKSPSPNGRYALRLTPLPEEEVPRAKADLVEKATGKVVLDLDTANANQLDGTVLVWSADSKWVAYGTREAKGGETSVYVSNGSDFELVELPDDLPQPAIKFLKAEKGGAKNYGGATKPLRWLKPGELELSSDQVMVARESGRTYTGVVKFTVVIDAPRKATVRKVGKSRTKVER